MHGVSFGAHFVPEMGIGLLLIRPLKMAEIMPTAFVDLSIVVSAFQRRRSQNDEKL